MALKTSPHRCKLKSCTSPHRCKLKWPHTRQQSPTFTNPNYAINQAIFAISTLGNYGHTLLQRKNCFTRGDNNLIWICQEELEQPRYMLNLPCTVCAKQLDKNAAIVECRSPCCQYRAHLAFYKRTISKGKNNNAGKRTQQLEMSRLHIRWCYLPMSTVSRYFSQRLVPLPTH